MNDDRCRLISKAPKDLDSDRDRDPMEWSFTLQRRTTMNIEKKTVLITGANRGIGRALLNEALKRGAQRIYAGTRGTLQHIDERVTPVTLDVTNVSHIERAVDQIDTLDVLINNAGIAIYDDLSNLDVIEQHLSVNLFGVMRVTQAFLPLLKRSKGAILNNVSLAGLAALPVVPAYSVSKAALFNITQSYRALLAAHGVSVHAVVLGPVDTDINRGFDVPKASPESAARNIFDGLAQGDEEIFPDPASQSIAEGWRSGPLKAMERQFAAFVPASSAKAAR
jgi:NAD(P)-dependent dehydrogenase (short-subunit alcohol dehydrogenase family)